MKYKIASRVDTEAAQTISVDGVIFRIKLVEVGTARDDNRGLGIILLANNPTDASMTPLYDLGVTVTHGGKPLDVSWVKSEHFGSSSVSTGQSAVIAPGAVDMQIFLGFILDDVNGDGTRYGYGKYKYQYHKYSRYGYGRYGYGYGYSSRPKAPDGAQTGDGPS